MTTHFGSKVTHRSRVDPADGKEKLWNWAGTYGVPLDVLHFPASVEEVQAIVTESTSVRVAGSMHSCAPLVQSDDAIISFRDMDKILDINTETKRVRFQAGVTIAKLCSEISKVGLAVEQLGTIDYQTTIGAVMTGTHGGSTHLGSIHTYMTSLTLVKADGTVKTISKDNDPEEFRYMMPSMGVLGVAVEGEIQCCDAFELRGEVEVIPMEDLPAKYRTYCDDNKFLRCVIYATLGKALIWKVNPPEKGQDISDDVVYDTYVNWRSPEEKEMLQKWLVLNSKKATHEDADKLLGELLVKQCDRLNPDGRKYRAANNHVLCLEKYNGIPHGNVELGFDFEKCETILTSIIDFMKVWRAPYYTFEVRATAQDDAFISCCYDRPMMWLDFQSPNEHCRSYFGILIQHLSQFGFRKHWAKGLENSRPELIIDQFPQLADFAGKVAEYDPDAKFQNDYTIEFFESIRMSESKSFYKDFKGGVFGGNRASSSDHTKFGSRDSLAARGSIFALEMRARAYTGRSSAAAPDVRDRSNTNQSEEGEYNSLIN